MPRQSLGSVGIKGLNADTPSQALEATEFAEGKNLRPFDGSLQGVWDFEAPGINALWGQRLNGSTDRRNILALAQWTPTGSAVLNIAYLWNNGSNIIFQVANDITNDLDLTLTGATAVTDLEENPRFNLDLFAFNDLLITNDGTNQPIVVRNNGTLADPNYQASFILGWPGGTGDETTQAPPESRVTAEKMTFYQNRLIALNINDNYLGGGSVAQFGNASFIWSSPITDLETLNNVTFEAASTNSAGDDILTETPGEVLDAAALGEYLIVYKEDGVFRVTDAGAPLYLVAELLFDDDGLYNPGCFADIGGGKHFVVGNYGIYLHDGGPNKENISRGRIESEVYADVDADARNRVFVFRHSRDNEVWVAYSSIDRTGTTTGCDKAFVYNYKHDTWHQRDLVAPGTVNGIRGMTETELDGQVYIYGWGNDGPVRLATDRDYEDPGMLAEGFVRFLRHDMEAPGFTKNISAVYPLANSEFNLSVRPTNSLEAPVDFTESSVRFDRTFDPVGIQGEYKKDYRLNGRYFNFELKMKDSINPTITGFDIEILQRGRR